MTDTTDIPQYPLIINGEQREPLSGEYMDVVNPASGQIVARAAMGGKADLDEAVTRR
jgi:aldehyde dehydrogenase (NAD+)